MSHGLIYDDCGASAVQVAAEAAVPELFDAHLDHQQPAAAAAAEQAVKPAGVSQRETTKRTMRGKHCISCDVNTCSGSGSNA